MKKILKIGAISLLVLIVIGIAIPFVFGGTLKDKVRSLINKQVEAQVDFADLSVSLWRSFPQASVIIDELSVVNKNIFEGDTLIFADKIALDMSIKELFKGSEEPINIQKIIVDRAKANIIVDSLGNANYDIAKKSDVSENTTTEADNEGFTFDLEHYEVNSSYITYTDQVTKTTFVLENFNHVGDGTLSGDTAILNTTSNTQASFSFDDVQYLEKNILKLDAIFDLDLANQKYTFKENKAIINHLPLEFEGFVQLFEDYSDVDIRFKTPSSDFKNFLAVIPSAYTSNFEGVETSGNFVVKGSIKGKSDDTYIPKLDIQATAENASFKYPDLPKTVRNISMNAALKNTSGIAEDTFLTIDNLTFTIDEDVFKAKGNFKNITGNMLVDLMLKGKLNLENLNKAYPVELEQQLNGLVTLDVSSQFDMNSLEKENYQNVKSSGNATIQNFSYASPEIPNTVTIERASVNFNPGIITLDTMKATTGSSDMTATGSIENLMGFLFAKQDLKGTFDITSNTFAVADFMVSDQESTQKSTTQTNTSQNNEGLKIPSFLDATLNFSSNEVIYDNLKLKNTKGSVLIKNETAYLKNVTSSLFDGGIAFNGNVSTKSETPTFEMNLDLSKVNIAQSFSGLDLLKNLAPITKALTGLLNTDINLKGNLSKDLVPKLPSIQGNAFAEILNAKVNASQTPLLSKLDSRLDFINLDKLDLKDIKANLNFGDGKIQLKPTTFNVKDIGIQLSGNHGFDKNMNYTALVQVPASYFGSKVSSLLSNLSAQEASNLKVDVPISITGNFTNPTVNANTGTAVKNLTQRIVATQKEKAKEKVTEKGKDLLKDLLGNSKEQKTDSVAKNKKTEDKLKDAAKDVLGGFLGGKRKKTKDSTQ